MAVSTAGADSCMPGAWTPVELLGLARSIALEAGELALAARAAGRGALEAGIRHKSSRTDLATEADRANEDLIRRRLAEARPDDAVLGEEGGGRPGTSGLVWIVDPIDGTTNFVYEFGSFAVSIAVAEELREGEDSGSVWPGALGELLGTGRILAGVVHDPARGETFCAALGTGAAVEDTPLAVAPGPLPLDEALIGTGFSYDAGRRRGQASLLQTVLPGVRDLRRGGVASLDLCYVAAGRLDGYYEAEVNAWDVAAGMLIAAEAGARCTALAGLAPGGPTAIACRPAIAEPLEELLRRAAAHS